MKQGVFKSDYKTYQLVEENGQVVAIKCNWCGMTSYNQNDVKYKYCGNCHKFHVEGGVK